MMSKMEIDFTDGPINPLHTEQESNQESPLLENKPHDGNKGHHSNSSAPSRSCHHCRVKKKLNCRVYNCSNEQCRLAFCENCLRKHYEATLTDAEVNQDAWACPKCRGICRCSHCKERGDPSHRISRRNKDKEISLEKNEVIAPRKAKMNAMLQEKEEASSDFEAEMHTEHNIEQIESNEDLRNKKMPKRLEVALESLFIQMKNDNGTMDENAIKNLVWEIGNQVVEKHAYTLKDSASRTPLHILAMTDFSLEVIEHITQGKEKLLHEMLIMKTDTKQTPLHYASSYGSEKLLKYFVDIKEDWIKNLLKAKDKEGKTCYDKVKNEAVRQILEPFFHREWDAAHAPKEAKHIIELTSLVSRKRIEYNSSELHPLVEKSNAHKRKKLNVDHDTCGIEAVDKARNLPQKKTGPFKDFMKYLSTRTSPISIIINKRISNEANWIQHGTSLTYSSSLFCEDGMNIQDAWIRSDAFDNYYQLVRVDDSKDWVRIDNSKVGTEGQIGLFANVELTSGMCLCEFAGKLVSKSVVEKQPFGNRKYLVDVHSMDFDIDAETIGNESRFINNSADRPNAHLITVYSEDGPHVLVFTKKTIKPDDEILIDFGPQFSVTGVMTNVW